MTSRIPPHIPRSIAYPKQAAFGRVLPKSKIYEHCEPAHALKDLFVAAGGADCLAVQAGSGNHQPAGAAGRAGDSGLRHPAQDAEN